MSLSCSLNVIGAKILSLLGDVQRHKDQSVLFYLGLQYKPEAEMVLTSLFLSFSQFECDLCSKDFESAQGTQTSPCDQQSQRTQGTAKKKRHYSASVSHHGFI